MISKEKRREIALRWNHNNKELCKQMTRKTNYRMRETNYEKYILHRAASNAKKQGIEFCLTESDVPVPEYCPVLGIKLDRHATPKTRSFAPSVDRIDNNKGYIPGNVVIVSLKANRIKNDASVEELEKVLNFYKGLQDK